MTILNELSDVLATTVANASPYIVRVDARRRLPATGIVWNADGVIITAHHVIKREDNIMVGLNNGDTVSAKLVARDPSSDLAVLRVDTSLSAPVWADIESVRVGHLVLALGRPHTDVKATLGVISALGQFWRTPTGSKMSNFVQSDVVMYPGFSGGPLVDANGHFIGMNTSGLSRAMSIAVPTATLRNVVNDLLTHGHVRRGYLGVAMQPVRLPANIAETLEQETGLLIVSVESGSPAEASGLVLGDTIVSFDGEPVRHIDGLLTMLGGETIGRDVDIQIVRSGSLQTVTVTIGEHE